MLLACPVTNGQTSTARGRKSQLRPGLTGRFLRNSSIKLRFKSYCAGQPRPRSPTSWRDPCYHSHVGLLGNSRQIPKNRWFSVLDLARLTPLLAGESQKRPRHVFRHPPVRSEKRVLFWRVPERLEITGTRLVQRPNSPAAVESERFAPRRRTCTVRSTVALFSSVCAKANLQAESRQPVLRGQIKLDGQAANTESRSRFDEWLSPAF
jgi:hypothetical protein